MLRSDSAAFSLPPGTRRCPSAPRVPLLSPGNSDTLWGSLGDFGVMLTSHLSASALCVCCSHRGITFFESSQGITCKLHITAKK